MESIIVTNNNHKKLLDYISEIEAEMDQILIASAFFSDHSIIENWINSNKNVQLLISLRPPTNYYSLKKIISNRNINIRFLGKDFHSKFIIFLRNEIPIQSIIGSSNFTMGGLETNIETNVITKDLEFSKNLLVHFKVLWEKSNNLEPFDLERFKKIFDDFQARSDSKLEDDFEIEISKNRNIKKIISTDVIKAKQYLLFWKIVDEIKDIVSDVSKKEYPDIPVYLAIDHFWHWVKIVWGKENKNLSSPDKTRIRSMFIEYCQWDKNGAGKNHTTKMSNTSKNIFQKYLSQDELSKLTREKAKLIYKSLHSGEARSNRFASDLKFVNKNDIDKIIKSLKYLLYSNDDIELKIFNMNKDNNFKLNEFGPSGIQELIGWVYPEKYPMRNHKANTAVEMLGYKM